jgi:hypothetical protein
MWSDKSGESFTFPGLSDLLRQFGAPVFVVELPHIGATHRFGSQAIDGQLSSVDAETVQGFEAHAVARTIRRLGVRSENSDPDSLLATTLMSFLVTRTGDDSIPAEVDAAERTSVRLHVVGELREVAAVHCRDHTGATFEMNGHTVVAVLPTDHLDHARLEMIAAAGQL